MHRLLFALLLATTLLGPAKAQDMGDLGSMSVEQLQAQAPDLHPAALYVLAARLLASGNGREAANWMYAAQLRYRFLLVVEGATGSSNSAVLFSALTEQVGRPVNEYIGGNVDEWLAAVDWALEWDAANPNGTTSKTEHAKTLAELRAGLQGFRASIEERRDTIPGEREANGLENR
ncbi:hypothetical protein [Mesorhizobium sp. CAU 1732]|uniref:hypothetical protein n=1 Tax=Mesorhizobium sp. CAU 1732 TaxID=3140358 RepID=UPI0032615088